MVPITYEPPGLLSITMGTPICCDICWASARMSASGAPPGAEGTMSRIGFSGYAARAGCASAAEASTSAESRKRLIMEEPCEKVGRRAR